MPNSHHEMGVLFFVFNVKVGNNITFRDAEKTSDILLLQIALFDQLVNRFRAYSQDFTCFFNGQNIRIVTNPFDRLLTVKRLSFQFFLHSAFFKAYILSFLNIHTHIGPFPALILNACFQAALCAVSSVGVLCRFSILAHCPRNLYNFRWVL